MSITDYYLSPDPTDFSCCTFRLTSDVEYRCPHGRWVPQDGYSSRFPLCIFHWWAGGTANLPDDILAKTLHKFISKSESDYSVTTFDFRGFRFAALDLTARVFEKPVNCDTAYFGSEVNFSRAVFHREVNFQRASFRCAPRFDQVQFMAPASFAGCAFDCPRMDFSKVDFRDKGDFSGVTVTDKCRVVFIDTTFGQGADFSSSDLLGRLEFTRSGQDERVSCFAAQSLFREVRITKHAQLVFDGVSVEHISFLDSDLELVAFRDVGWFRPKSGLWMARRDRALRDEFVAQSAAEYEKIAENYRQLVINHERKRDFSVAEDFHIGEMEVQRKKKRRVSGYTLYLLLSRYGTSYWQALVVLVGLIVLISVGFLLGGFTDLTTGEGIEYSLFSNSGNHWTSPARWFPDFLRACSFSLSILTLQRQRSYEPAGLLSQVLISLATIVFTGQAALLLLAIRRRFRRS